MNEYEALLNSYRARVLPIMVRYMGKSSLGLGYAVALSDLVLATFMPSNTSRSAGTIYPVASNCTVADIQKAFLKSEVYCGIPAGVEVFRAAKEIIDEWNK